MPWVDRTPLKPRRFRVFFKIPTYDYSERVRKQQGALCFFQDAEKREQRVRIAHEPSGTVRNQHEVLCFFQDTHL